MKYTINIGGRPTKNWKASVSAAYIHKINEGQEIVGEGISSHKQKKLKPSYKCLDCPNMIIRGKRCPTCAERKHNSYNMAEPSEIMNKRWKI